MTVIVLVVEVDRGVEVAEVRLRSPVLEADQGVDQGQAFGKRHCRAGGRVVLEVGVGAVGACGCYEIRSCIASFYKVYRLICFMDFRGCGAGRVVCDCRVASSI